MVDEHLEVIYVRLCPSMRKFVAKDAQEAEMEPAKTFIGPGTAKLCG